MTDAAAAAAALKAGDIQVLDDVSTRRSSPCQADRASPVDQADAASAGRADRSTSATRTGSATCRYTNVGTPLASSPMLRQAFEEAIDRDAMNRVVFGGLVQPSCTPISPASSLVRRDAVKCTPYDPTHGEEARRRSRASRTRPCTCWCRPAPTALRQAQFIQAAGGGGRDQRRDRLDRLRDLAEHKRTRERTTRSRSAGPVASIRTATSTNSSRRPGSQNDSGYSNPRLDLILANARKASTDTARKTLYRAAQKLILADQPLIYLYHPITFASLSAKVTGISLYPDTLLRVAFAAYR